MGWLYLVQVIHLKMLSQAVNQYLGNLKKLKPLTDAASVNGMKVRVATMALGRICLNIMLRSPTPSALAART